MKITVNPSPLSILDFKVGDIITNIQSPDDIYMVIEIISDTTFQIISLRGDESTQGHIYQDDKKYYTPFNGSITISN